MAKYGDVPVYLSTQDGGEKKFLGRFPVNELEKLVDSFHRWGCFDGDDILTNAFSQYFIDSRGLPASGFEIVVGPEDA